MIRKSILDKLRLLKIKSLRWPNLKGLNFKNTLKRVKLKKPKFDFKNFSFKNLNLKTKLADLKNTLAKIEFQRLKSISAKLLISTFVSIAAVSALTVAVSLISLSTTTTRVSREQLDAAINTFNSEISTLEQQAGMVAESIALNRGVIDALSANKIADAGAEVERVGSSVGIEFSALTDSSGVVLTSNNSPSGPGENISWEDVVQNALNHQSTSEIGLNAAGVYTVRAAAPVLDATNRTLGVVVVGYRLDNPELVDKLKEQTFRDFSIFAGDTRINSTLTQNGQRLVGGQLDPKVAKRVLEHGERFVGNLKIEGQPYMVAYEPIRSGNGITGVLFTGYSIRELVNQSTLNAIIIILSGLLGVALGCIMVLQVLRSSLKSPLESVVQAAQSIEKGEFSEEVVEKLALIQTGDEIDRLARSIEKAIASIQKLAIDTEGLVQAAEKDDISARVELSAHQGIYRTIMDIVNRLLDLVVSTLNEIELVAHNITDGSSHVSNAAQELSMGATQQAASVQELLSTVDEVKNQVRFTNQNAQRTSEFSEECRAEGEESNQKMFDLLQAMDEIRMHSAQLTKVIKSINDIALQTNVLALNAAVEAARAGEAGKGFGVVATEIRALSERSAEAARSTTQLISDSEQSVRKGTNLAKITARSLERVVEKTQMMRTLMDEIAHATSQQSDAIIQIDHAMAQISAVVQTNSATAEETAAQSEELSAQASQLESMVEKYERGSQTERRQAAYPSQQSELVHST